MPTFLANEGLCATASINLCWEDDLLGMAYQQDFDILPPVFILAVFADSTKSFLLGAPAEPGLRIFSPEPSAIRSRFALMLAYKPFGFFAMINPED
jgi:hypothetical protein